MTTHSPVLIVFCGLPGMGKTTLARGLTRRLGATYLRVDAIEQALRGAGSAVGSTGYVVANAVAAENLRLGRIVIADCVNPVLASRIGWWQTALQESAQMAEIELVCSSTSLHRERVETRTSDIKGLKLPSWDEVLNRNYEPWDREHLVLDTAIGSLDDLVAQAEAYVRDIIATK